MLVQSIEKVFDSAHLVWKSLISAPIFVGLQIFYLGADCGHIWLCLFWCGSNFRKNVFSIRCLGFRICLVFGSDTFLDSKSSL